MFIYLCTALRRWAPLLAAVGLGLATATGHATLVRLNGANFDVEYDDAVLGLFGAPTIGGNVVFFTPTTFKAESLNGVGLITANANASFRIIAQSGYLIGSADLTARGDYRLLGASSTVTVGGAISAIPAGVGNAPLAAPITSASPLTLRTGAISNWNASAILDFGGAPSGGFADILFDMQSFLSALTSTADIGPKLAFIEEKFAGSAFSLQLTPTGHIPEPSSFVLLFAAGLAWFAVRCGKRR